MLLPRFEVHRPRTLDEAVSLARHLGDFDWLAGGTDLLPNYKHRLNARPHVIMLCDVAELRGVSATRIGALARLAEIERSAELGERLPAVGQAVRLVASPLLRESGTLGGNLCLDTRCFYFNQSELWRRARGGCLKEGGKTCIVVPRQEGPSCWATYSGDLAPLLQVLGARAGIAGPSGRRVVAVENLYCGDGIRRNVLERGELLTHVEIPVEAQALAAGYMKLRQRDVIDFPIAGVCVGLRVEAGVIAALRVSVTGVDMTPVFFDLSSEHSGKRLTPELARTIAASMQAKVQPKKNVALRPMYRRKMVGVFVRRLLERLLP